MQTSDRIQFEAHFEKLCLGTATALRDARTEAFWVGLAKMDLPNVVRVIDHVLQLEDPRMPKTPGAFWHLLREVNSKARAPAPLALTPPPAEDTRDAWERAGARHLGCYQVRRQVRGKFYTVDELEILRRSRDAWVEDMRELVAANQVPEDGGKAAWEQTMVYAEQAIETLRGGQAVAS